MAFTDNSPAPDFQTPGQGGQQQDNTIPRFYSRPIEVPFKTAQAGHPVFEDRHFVEILIPGDRRTVVDRPVKDEDKHRWPRQWHAYQTAQETPLEGTPLAEWSGITRSQAEELSYSHVRTVEQLSNLSDDQLTKAVSMGGYALREKAKRWLEQAAGAAPAEKLAAEVEKRDAKITEMQAAIDALSAETARLKMMIELKIGGTDAGT